MEVCIESIIVYFESFLGLFSFDWVFALVFYQLIDTWNCFFFFVCANGHAKMFFFITELNHSWNRWNCSWPPANPIPFVTTKQFLFHHFPLPNGNKTKNTFRYVFRPFNEMNVHRVLIIDFLSKTYWRAMRAEKITTQSHFKVFNTWKIIQPLFESREIFWSEKNERREQRKKYCYCRLNGKKKENFNGKSVEQRRKEKIELEKAKKKKFREFRLNDGNRKWKWKRKKRVSVNEANIQ